MSEKMAVVAPMPRASVSIAVSVKTGDKRICRSAYATSCRSVCIGNPLEHIRIAQEICSEDLQTACPTLRCSLFFASSLSRHFQEAQMQRRSFLKAVAAVAPTAGLQEFLVT